MIKDMGENNHIRYGKNVNIVGSIIGNNNSISISESRYKASLDIAICGNNNSISINDIWAISNLKIRIGSHARVSESRVEIGVGFSCVSCSIHAMNSKSLVHIGSQCLFSEEIVLRCGEMPHLIFDLDSGRYLDGPSNVIIGDRVWVGQRAFLTKRSSVPSNSIVAACSVVTKAFDDPYVVLAGNPAEVVKRGVKWFANASHLEPGGIYERSFLDSIEN